MVDVLVGLSVSLDGFITGPNDGVDNPLGDGGGRLFQWMNAGGEERRINRWLAPPETSRRVVDEWQGTGAIVVGRKTFDIARGWAYGHPIDVPIFVVTHHEPEHGDSKMLSIRPSPSKEMVSSPWARPTSPSRLCVRVVSTSSMSILFHVSSEVAFVCSTASKDPLT
jgi:hypothetical protein